MKNSGLCHLYDRQCGCNDCTNHEIKLRQQIKKEEYARQQNKYRAKYTIRTATK